MPSEDYQFYDVMFHDLDWSDFVEEEEFIEEFTEAYDAFCWGVVFEVWTTGKTQDSTSYTDISAHLGGYTTFPQEDPREYSTGFEGLDAPLDTILLQINLSGEVLWFYIQQSDLIQQDFSRVFYTLENTL